MDFKTLENKRIFWKKRQTQAKIIHYGFIFLEHD